MSRTPVILITGASGEIGHGLIERLSTSQKKPIVTLDLAPLAPGLSSKVRQHYIGSILDSTLLDRILAEFEIDMIFHLAAVLSTGGEFAPLVAHKVNVEGTLAMLEFAQREGESHGRPVVFLYPSSIAAYGIPNLKAKAEAGRVREEQFNTPTTMYGCNKLYGEHLGIYYAGHYKQLSETPLAGKVDFRGIRFPGLISAITLPSGGTSDFAPEMIHAAAQGKPYACFVRPDTRIPFMAMPDAIEAMIKLALADKSKLSRHVYNIDAFSPTAEDVAAVVRKAFPKAELSTVVDTKRQGIVDTWPAEVDDSTARRDWGFEPRYNFTKAFEEYLIPTIHQRYAE
ncbi:NAD-dependent epimerase/dehydratase family protein [Telmatocola sphagniphila]|uniref:NAD-dependent epimerase/dehydratase family protein n=1 Tax=Telmatocola sphagniphila TaxID=1123043 RepID=A0A8E6B4P2_9BACT|nr:NAD-dependent epimerase/dehydratase family protein [Telmatocola sphagniphila]QVL31277.1 NAD-dependent epimerase/dehydratase family protein [Telmatocola sphagniphila]